MQLRFRFLYWMIICFGSLPVLAQKEKVNLDYADNLFGEVRNGQELRRLVGNVQLSQGNTRIYCDSAYLFSTRNFLEAFGNVRIQQGDSVTVTGRKATYDGNTKQARMRENVVLNDQSKTLSTEQLDYDMNTSVAYYPDKGTIVEGENTITSKQGFYNTQTKIFTFEKDVVMISPKYKLTSDKVIYNSLNKVAYFTTLTHIEGKDGTLVSTDGEYNTVTGISDFRARSSIEYETYTLSGDRLHYNKQTEKGIATGNVVLFSQKDSVIVEGDTGRYYGLEGISKVHGKAQMKKIMKKDTLYITADTLISLQNKQTNTKRVYAYRNVRIFRKDLQGKSDSLVYNYADSTLQFYRDPVLWNERSQLSADTITIQLAHNAMDKLFLKTNSFVISLDTLKNYNQVRGRQMVAYFDTTSQLNRMTVNGNCENVTWVLNDNNSNIRGVYKVECGNMNVKMAEGQVQKVAFLNNPDAVFIPPHEISEPDTRLRGFKWRDKEKPTKKDVLIRDPLTPLPKPAKAVKTTKDTQKTPVKKVVTSDEKKKRGV